MTSTTPHAPSVHPMPSPLRYDLKIWLASRGRERAFRERQLDLAHLTSGESVLDIGSNAGLDVVETGPIESGMRRLERLRYVLASRGTP